MKVKANDDGGVKVDGKDLGDVLQEIFDRLGKLEVEEQSRHKPAESVYEPPKVRRNNVIET